MYIIGNSNDTWYDVFDTDDFSCDSVLQKEADAFFRKTKAECRRYKDLVLSIRKVRKSLFILWLRSKDKHRVVVYLFNPVSHDLSKPIDVKTSREGGFSSVDVDVKKNEIVFHSGWYKGEALLFAKILFRDSPLAVKYVPYKTDSAENKRIMKDADEFDESRRATIKDYQSGKQKREYTRENKIRSLLVADKLYEKGHTVFRVWHTDQGGYQTDDLDELSIQGVIALGGRVYNYKNGEVPYRAVTGLIKRNEYTGIVMQEIKTGKCIVLLFLAEDRTLWEEGRDKRKEGKLLYAEELNFVCDKDFKIDITYSGVSISISIFKLNEKGKRKTYQIVRFKKPETKDIPLRGAYTEDEVIEAMKRERIILGKPVSDTYTEQEFELTLMKLGIGKIQ